MELFSPTDYVLDYPYWGSRRKMILPLGMLNVFARTSKVTINSDPDQKFTLVDVGACVGAFLIPFRCRWKDTIIHAIEPSANAYPYLRYNTQGMENVFLYNVAVSDKIEKKVMSFIPGRHGELGIETFYGDGGGAQTVKAFRLDAIITDHVDLIKLDVEGHELACIDGAKGILERDHPDVIMELKDERQAKAGYSVVDAVVHMKNLDYVVADQISNNDIIFRWKGRLK